MTQWIETPDSSNVKQFSYNDQTLTVQFNNGGVYDYHEVPVVVYEAMKVAPSVGSFLAKSIKKVYKFTKWS